MPEKIIHEIRLNQYIACPADRTRRFSLGTRDSYGVEQLRIVPGEGWDGLMITATFHPPEGEAVQVIVPADGLIDVPPEATRSGSELPIKYGKIVFAGVADGVQRISCNLPYTVMDHAPVDGAASSGPSPSWYEQAAAHFLPSGGKAGQVLAKASDADLDVEWADAKAVGDQLSALNEANAAQNTEIAKKANDADLAPVAKSGSYNDLTDKPTISVDGSYLPVNSDDYAADANSVTTTQITKTDNYTLNLPNEITREKWGVIQFVAENDSAGNGTQMYWPIDSAYAGRMYIRGHNKNGWTKWKRYATTSEIPTVPTKLPNPNALTFTGAVSATYDGSAPMSVEIPSGGGGAGGEVWKLLSDETGTEDVTEYKRSFESVYRIAVLFYTPGSTGGGSVNILINGAPYSMAVSASINRTFPSVSTLYMLRPPKTVMAEHPTSNGALLITSIAQGGSGCAAVFCDHNITSLVLTRGTVYTGTRIVIYGEEW